MSLQRQHLGRAETPQYVDSGFSHFTWFRASELLENLAKLAQLMRTKGNFRMGSDPGYALAAC